MYACLFKDDADDDATDCDGRSEDEEVEEEDYDVTDSDARKTDGSASDKEDALDGVSLPRQVFNIIKNIVGEGMLSLAAAMSKGTGVFPAILITLLMALLFTYSFSMIGRVAHATHEKRFNEIGSALSSKCFGTFISVVCMLKTAMTCLAFSISISELGQDIFKAFGMEGFWTIRQVVLVLFTLFILTPLCLIRDLSMLSITSIIGVLCEVGVIVFMTARYLDGSYAEGGEFFCVIEEKFRPSFPEGVALWDVHLGTIILLDSMTTAFICHYNAPKFYFTLRDRSVKRFNLAVCIAFGVAAVLYVWCMLVAYLTFGVDSNGLILNNYAHTDSWATVARFGILFAVVFAYPLGFTGLRDATINLVGMNTESAGHACFFSVTFAWILFVFTVAALFKDLGLVNSLGGAILGSLITMGFPGILGFLALRSFPSQFFKCENVTTIILLVLAVLLFFLGSSTTLIESFTTLLDIDVPPKNDTCSANNTSIPI